MPQPKQGADIAPQVQVKTPTVTVITDGNQSQVLRVPKSHDEMNALIVRRDQLSQQLEDVTDRRDNLIEQMRTVPGPAMAGLQSQLGVLDARVLQLENDLATTGQEIAGASPQLVAMARESQDEDSNGSFDDGVGAGVAGSLGVMAVLLFFGFRRFRRMPRNRAPLMIAADSQRLQRVEQGMEAMAIEIERISEGQRFVTKLLSESRNAEPTPR